MKPLHTNFAIVDVQRGRKALAKQIKAGKTFRVHLIVDLDTQHSRDDGTSIEFSGDVVEARIEENR